MQAKLSTLRLSRLGLMQAKLYDICLEQFALLELSCFS